MKSHAATSDSHLTCRCMDMAGLVRGSTVTVNQALGSGLIFTSHSVDWRSISCTTEASIALDAGVLASYGSDEFSSRTCSYLKRVTSPKAMTPSRNSHLVITHIQWWMQGTKPRSLTLIQNNSKGPLQLQGLPWDWLTLSLCMAIQLPLPNPASFTPP